MIFYFTATGNSLYVAKQLSPRPISIPQVGEDRVFTDEQIGIVCPVYCGELPGIVLDFIRRSSFCTPYLFLVLTYGLDESDSAEYTARQCREYGVTFDYIAHIKMVDNYLPAFDMGEEKALDKKIPGQIAALRAALKRREKGIPAATEAGRRLHQQVKEMNRQQPSLNDGSALSVTGGCIGCGICTRVCPVGNLILRDGKAVRLRRSCEFCLACIQNCPHNAIRLEQEKNPRERYRHPEISLAEIIESNSREPEKTAGSL
ncbi:MAG: EFR1 family ferrodoxin [Candidatus Heritagella sp.]